MNGINTQNSSIQCYIDGGAVIVILLSFAMASHFLRRWNVYCSFDFSLRSSSLSLRWNQDGMPNMANNLITLYSTMNDWIDALHFALYCRCIHSVNCVIAFACNIGTFIHRLLSIVLNWINWKIYYAFILSVPEYGVSCELHCEATIQAALAFIQNNCS